MASRSPGSLGFPGNSSSRDAPSFDRCLLRTGTLLHSTLDSWRLGGELYSVPSKTADVAPSCSSDWGRSLFQASLPCLMSWWHTRRAPSTGDSYYTGASLQRSRPVPRSAVLDVLALTCSALDQADGVPCFLAGMYSVPFTPGYSTVPQFQAHLSGFLPWARGPRARAVGGSLHTGAIIKSLSAGGVSGSALYSSALLPTGSLPSSYRKVALRPKLRSPSHI